MELKDRYRLKRDQAFQNGKISAWIRLKEFMHPPIVKAVRLARITSRQWLAGL